MNRIVARIVEVATHEGISQLRFEAEGIELTMLGLAPPPNAQPGKEAIVEIKPTHLLLAKAGFEGMVAIDNRLPVVVESIEEGKILASVALRFGKTPLEAIAAKSALAPLGLRPGSNALALFSASEVAIVEVL